MAGEYDAARGQRIRARREQLGLSIEDVAARTIDPVGRTVGAGPATIAEWEAGADPGKAKLERLAAVLQVSWRWLANGDTDTGTRIAQLRFERGMTQADLAKAVGMATQGPSNSRTVQTWESGAAQVRDDTLERVAEALGSTVRYLRAGETGGTVDELERRRRTEMRPATKGELGEVRDEVSELREELRGTQQALSELLEEVRGLGREVRAGDRRGSGGRRRQGRPSNGNSESDG